MIRLGLMPSCYWQTVLSVNLSGRQRRIHGDVNIPIGQWWSIPGSDVVAL